ncbi:MAG: sulfur carrier protein ThiS [Pseudomonadota bacterium]
MTGDIAQSANGIAIVVNGEWLQPDNPSLAHLLYARGIIDARGVAVAINGAILPQEQWPNQRLKAGDRVEIVKVMVGG